MQTVSRDPSRCQSPIPGTRASFMRLSKRVASSLLPLMLIVGSVLAQLAFALATRTGDRWMCTESGSGGQFEIDCRYLRSEPGGQAAHSPGARQYQTRVAFAASPAASSTTNPGPTYPRF